jgi:hypothetical protein
LVVGDLAVLVVVLMQVAAKMVLVVVVLLVPTAVQEQVAIFHLSLYKAVAALVRVAQVKVVIFILQVVLVLELLEQQHL